MNDYNTNRVFTISAKVTALEKIRYTKIATSHRISLSEWITSILNVYQNAYGDLKINSVREDELLNEIDKLNKTIAFLDARNKFWDVAAEISLKKQS